jgi:hypothetical protein
MTSNGKQLKSTTELMAELARIDALVETSKGDEANAHQQIRSLARAAITDDGKAALGEIRSCEAKLGLARMDLKRLADARQEVEAEFDQALAAEAQTEREKAAAEAEAYAETLPGTFKEADRTFAEFHKAFSACIDAVNTGRSRGWNLPSAELFQAKLIRALKTSLSVGELRMLNMPPLPSPERCSFESLGEAYAQSIRGGAKRSLMPPPAPLPQPVPAGTNTETRMPQHVDIGMRLPGDGPDFEVRVPQRG